MYAFVRRRGTVLAVFLLFCCVLYFMIHGKVVERVPFWATPVRFIPTLNNSKYPSPKLLPCGWEPETFLRPTRSQCYLHCGRRTNSLSSQVIDMMGLDQTMTTLSSIFSCKEVSGDAPVAILSPEDPTCLERFLKNYCYGAGHTIPRVAHYVRFGAYNMTLDAFFSMYSVARFLQPCVILLHGDAIPTGPYWRALLHLVPNIVHVPRVRPREIFGNRIDVPQHSSDVARLRILIEHGGIYVDSDQLLLNPFDDLLNKSTVLGHEVMNKSINNALMVAAPGSQFLRIWLSRYTTFNDKLWQAHSTQLPVKLVRNYSHLVHVVRNFFGPCHPHNRPFYAIGGKRTFPWRKHYSVHLYTRLNQGYFYRAERVDKQRHVIGGMIRYILYGDKDACLNQNPRNTSKAQAPH